MKNNRRNHCLTGAAITTGKTLAQMAHEHLTNTHKVCLIDYSKGYRDLVWVGATSLEALLEDPAVKAYTGPAARVIVEGPAGLSEDLVCFVGVQS